MQISWAEVFVKFTNGVFPGLSMDQSRDPQVLFFKIPEGRTFNKEGTVVFFVHPAQPILRIFRSKAQRYLFDTASAMMARMKPRLRY